jgi:hypothetical protein
MLERLWGFAEDDGMGPILEQIRATFDCGIWYPVVSSLLMLPDACGAIEYWGSEEIKKPSDRYTKWYDKWVHPHYHTDDALFDGSLVYIVRNAMMHESTAFIRSKHGFDRILFTAPNKSSFDCDFLLSKDNGGIEETALLVKIEGFLNAMERGVRNWLEEVAGDADDRRRLALGQLIKYRPEGVFPHVLGVPVVA